MVQDAPKCLNITQLADRHRWQARYRPERAGPCKAVPKAIARSPFEFERWCVMTLDGQPNEKQVGDRGIDGVIRIVTGKSQSDRVLISVKGGATNPGHVRDLLGTVSGERAAMGVFVCLRPITSEMQRVANTSGIYKHPGDGREYPRLQLITVEELLQGKRPQLPPTLLPYFQAQKRGGDPEAQQAIEI
jgi:Restriction endonuclease